MPSFFLTFLIEITLNDNVILAVEEKVGPATLAHCGVDVPSIPTTKTIIVCTHTWAWLKWMKMYYRTLLYWVQLTLKRLGHFFSKHNFIFSFWSPQVQYFYVKPVQYNEYLISIVDTDGLVLFSTKKSFHKKKYISRVFPEFHAPGVK